MSAAMGPPAEPMSSSDALLWTIERDPVLRSTVVVLCVLAGPPDVSVLRDRIAAAGHAFPRLHQHVAARRARPPRWIEHGPVDLDQHVQHVSLPSPASIRQVLDLAGTMAGEAFDPARPLWKIVVVDGIKGGRAALVMKVHHAVTDGIGGVALLSLLTDVGGQARSRPTQGSPGARTPAAVGRLVASLGTAAIHPLATIRAVTGAAVSAARLLAPATRALSPIATGRGLDRHLTTIDVSRADLAEAAHAVGGTLNDAFLAAVIGGLSRYHELHGAIADRLRVTMPISTRRQGDQPGGNRFSPVRFTVPATIADPAERMRALGEIAHQWRREPAIRHTAVLADALERLPGDVTTSIFGSMLKGVDVVVTNVPGPRYRARLGGAEIRRLYGFAPPAGAALSVALVTHVDRCCVGITVDIAAIPDPERLTACLREGFAEVSQVASDRAVRTRRTPS